MKKLPLTIFVLMLCNSLQAQEEPEEKKTSESAFWKHILISESMETAEKKEKPAQFMLTFPKNAPSSWLINLGVGYKWDSSETGISKIMLEYHKNTLTEKKQDNLQVGYGLVEKLTPNASSALYINADGRYVYDAVGTKNSLASTVLFSWYKRGEKGLNLNTETRFNKGKRELMLTLYGGTQIQGIFNAKDKDAKGFIIRPLYVLGAQYQFMNESGKPFIRLSLDYTGRVDAVNTSEYKEDYTDLFKAGADIFIVNEPVNISIGGSFNYGSDPMKGLAEQQFWLVSLNIGKKK
ncbi:hypothetical protein SAMN05421786_108213 [Chryseobacterium ureilyticum]|uniref:MetA-pathway of phenol degradation n=1 Tax=Chryseobacterium ureilyticum TaxID=373668 RepID=A0A1N7QBG3_9FLAO|nr:hypothetical protein [Chryseobacterium ureilyticum]SIT20191.1 hypothetical protein SAMN05421786_108213 [Chryseobacterium ureilyticum]